MPKRDLVATTAAVDIHTLTNGTIVAVATPLDSFGNLTTLALNSPTPTWTVTGDYPGTAKVLTLTPVATDPTGLTQTVTITLSTPVPSPLPTGLVISFSAGSVSGTSNLNDVVSGIDTAYTLTEQTV